MQIGRTTEVRYCQDKDIISFNAWDFTTWDKDAAIDTI